MLTASLLLVLMGPPASDDAAREGARISEVGDALAADAPSEAAPSDSEDAPSDGEAAPSDGEGETPSEGVPSPAAADPGEGGDSTQAADPPAADPPAADPPADASSSAEARRPPLDEVPSPTLVEHWPDPQTIGPAVPERWLANWFHQCLAQVEPCYRSRSARGLLAAAGALTTVSSVALIFSAGDRNRLGDPAMALAGAGTIAMGAATIGAVAAAVHADGPTLHDRITPPTLGLALGLGGSDHTDEAVPYRLAGTIAPTWRFRRAPGRARLVGRVGGDLGAQLERDPRPQATEADAFPVALESRGWNFDVGLDLAFGLPYPVARRDDRGHFGQFELRYKPLFFFARDTLTLGGGGGAENGGVQRVSQRVALTPLNLGLRWNLSPRQRFTFYMGPRWDLIGHGEPGALATSAPALGPIYGEAWFDIDIPMRKLARAQARAKPSVVGQFTTGYVHSRFYGSGMNFGSVVGFLGQVVAQFSLRVRPLGSPVGYQLELGATVGGGLNPYLRLGIVLPEIGAKR